MALGNLDLSEIFIADTEEFTCYTYGYPKNKCLNDVSKSEFDKKYNAKPGKNSVDCIKSFNIPSCSKVLLQQIKRVCYVAHLYSKAHDAFDLFPIDYGYKLSKNGKSFEIHWFCDKFRFIMKFRPTSSLHEYVFERVAIKISPLNYWFFR